METDFNFDKIRYVKLLNKDKILRSEDTCLLSKNRKERRELLFYATILENQIYYDTGYTYLVEAYLINKAKAGEAGARMFQWDFFSLFRKDNQALRTLEKEILKGDIEKTFFQMKKYSDS